MKRPVEVEQLLEELQAENPPSHAAVQSDSKMVLIVEDTEDRFEFNGEESKLLLSGQDSIERLFNVLEYPSESFIELHGITVDTQTMELLERYASTVDEI